MQSSHFRPIRRIPSLCVIAVALHAPACASEEQDADPKAAVAAALDEAPNVTAEPQTITLPQAPAQRLNARVKKLGVFSMQASLPDFTAEFESLEREWRPAAELTERPPGDDDPGQPVNWVGFRSLGDDRYEIELWQANSAELARFGEAARDAGAAQAFPGSLPITETEERFSPRTWSDGVDTRTRRATTDGYSASIWPFRTIGRMVIGDGCTGTLIGRRTVLTAAHCVFDRDDWTVVPGTFS